jgi:ceramide kinase
MFCLPLHKQGCIICRHLTQFTKKGSDPLSFKFVEHHKVVIFLNPSNPLRLNLIELSIICRHQHSHLSHHMTKVSGTWTERFFRRVRYLSKLAGALSTSLLRDQRCSASNAVSSLLVAYFDVERGPYLTLVRCTLLFVS